MRREFVLESGVWPKGGPTVYIWLCLDRLNRNRKLEISTVPTKAKSRESAYSQALIQNNS